VTPKNKKTKEHKNVMCDGNVDLLIPDTYILINNVFFMEKIIFGEEKHQLRRQQLSQIIWLCLSKEAKQLSVRIIY